MYFYSFFMFCDRIDGMKKEFDDQNLKQPASLQALSLYRRELADMVYSDPNKQSELIKKAKSGDMDCAEQLITAHLKLVYKIAYKYSGSDEQLLLDLIQEGNLGLVIAMQKYDEQKGQSFTSYAIFWIEKYIFSYLNDNRLIHIPTKTADKIKKLKKVITDLQQQLSHYPSVEEIAQNSNFDAKQIRKLLEYDYQISSLEYNDILSQLTTDNSNNEDEQISYIIEEIIDYLDDPLDKEILKLYLGIGQEKSMTFQEIGDKFNLSRQAIRARYVKSIKKIKEIYD